MQPRLKPYTKKLKRERLAFYSFICILLTACTSPPAVRGPAPTAINLPFLRLEQAGECYFIDDFMPTPDSLVNGKTSNLYLRYYTYWNANYKYWYDTGIMLAFYSKDLRCWSLFEEYSIPRIQN
jgi:hypothetical protein